MNCLDFKSGIVNFREGKLPAESHHSFEHHAASCPACGQLLVEYNKLDALIQLEKAAEPNPFAATRILQHIENKFEKSSISSMPRWIRVLQPVTIAVALLCGTLIGSYTAKNGHALANQSANLSDNIEFLRSNLFISEFVDEDKTLIINK